MQKDNGGLLHKLKIRRLLLSEIADPVIVETNGGSGTIFLKIYSEYESGTVFEKNIDKAAILVKQRPTWAVYCADCVKSISAGVGFHNQANFFDVDPYGDPWPIIEAVFYNKKNLPDRWGMAVNDGLKRFFMLGRGWSSNAFTEWVEKIGNDNMARQYTKIVREKFDSIADKAGFQVRKWVVHSSGHGGGMTHYAAVLERNE